MAVTSLSVAQIYAAIIAQVESEIGATIPIIPIAFVRVFAKAFAAVLVLVYKYTSFTWLQLYVSEASFKSTTINGVTVIPLVEWGRLVGAGDPVPAVPAELTATVQVTNQTGDPIPSGTPLVYDPTGVVYLMTATVLRDAATKTISIVAASDQTGGSGLGAIGNLLPGAIVSFTSPLVDVLRDATVLAVVVSGEDPEPEAQYRQRIIDRFQKPPQGGALADYEIWGEEAAGIINIYPYVGDQPGTVENYCEADPVSSGSADGIPTQAQLDAALASINLDVSGFATRRPANALAFTFPITRKEFKVEVYGLDAPDPAAAQQAIEDGMDTLFASFEPFIGGLTVTARDRVTQSEVSGRIHDIVTANNGTFSSALVKTQVDLVATFTAAVVASADDATEIAGTPTLTDTSLDLAVANTIGVRFLNVNVPVGATIDAATLTFTAESIGTAYSVVTVRGDSDTTPATFTTGANDISSRGTTTSFSEWLPDIWAVDDENAIAVDEMVSEIIATAGWAATNAMAFILTSSTGSDRKARSWDDDPAKAPELSITYTSPATAFSAVSLYTLVKGEKAKVSLVSFL